MDMTIRILVLHFMAMDHILTSVLHLHHKYALDLIGLSHHVPALYRSYKILSSSESWDDKTNFISQESSYMITYSYAYFLYEFFYYLKHKYPFRSIFDVQMFIHALMSSIGLYYVYTLRKYHFYVAVFLTWEASTPFLNLAKLMYNHNMSNHIAYKISTICFFVTFVTFRILLGSYIFWFYLWSQVNFGLKIAGVSLNVLNLIWFKNIIMKMT